MHLIKALLICTILVFGNLSLALAQPVPPGEFLPGCALSWTAPMVDDPANPGTLISSWELAGDHKGFVFNTRKDEQHVWDKLLEQKIEDPSLLSVDCPTIGVEELGTYSVGISPEDNALNLATPAWITIRLVAPDTEALDPIMEICSNGMLNGMPVKTCQRPGSP